MTRLIENTGISILDSVIIIRVGVERVNSDVALSFSGSLLSTAFRYARDSSKYPSSLAATAMLNNSSIEKLRGVFLDFVGKLSSPSAWSLRSVNSETQRKGDEPLPPDDCDKPICSNIRTATERSNNAMLIFFIFVERFSAPNPTDSAHFHYFYHAQTACQRVTHQRGRIWVARLVLHLFDSEPPLGIARRSRSWDILNRVLSHCFS